MFAFIRRLAFELGTGRAIENARQERQDLEFVHARIEAIGRALAAPTPAPTRLVRSDRAAA